METPEKLWKTPGNFEKLKETPRNSRTFFSSDYTLLARLCTVHVKKKRIMRITEQTNVKMSVNAFVISQ